MPDTFRKLSNPNFVIWAANLVTFYNANKAATNLSGSKVEDLAAKQTLLAENLALKQSLDDKIKAVNDEIKLVRNESNDIASQISTLVKNDSAVSNSTVEQLGFSANKSVNTSSTPNTPTDLVGKGTSDGINSLKWNRNGNRQGVMFIIEAKIGDAANYVMVSAETGSRFDHINQIPGVKIQYRVKAKRSNAESGFSNVAVVYP
jgi:hypothetical protein